jgi:hypothetical protein
VLDLNLWSKYHSQLNDPRNKGKFRLLSMLDVARQRRGKVNIRHTNASPFPEETTIPQGSQDDVPIVRLVVETGAILVTKDSRLVNNLNSCRVTEAYDLKALSPEEALKIL